MTTRRAVRLITRLNIGGPARQALLLTHRLQPEWKTVLAAGTPTEAEGELGDERSPVVRVPLVRPLSPLTDLQAVAAVRRLIHESSAQLLHTHMAKAGTVGRIAARTMRHRPRTIHTFHGHVLDGYFSEGLQQAFITTERVLARSTDVLVAVSEHVRDDLLELKIGQPEQYRVIPLGLDLSQPLGSTGRSGVLRAAIGLGDDVPLVVAMSRLVPIKDLGSLIDAISRVPDAHLAILGDGELRAELEAQAADSHAAGRVHFTGWWHDVTAALADADLVALSSRNEGTPVSLIEAAACGRAAVATDVGGVRSVIEDGVTGLLVPPADPAALSEAIVALLGDPERRRLMGQAARERAGRFSADRLVADISALYDELVPPA